ncbi:MAG: hypothetical protein RLZ98_408 [Pseudomonadota bacterium]|jgi:uroporphyrinogen decarboxylase
MAGRFLGVFAGEVEGPPPIWLMRQAGRYLPEYREVRARAGSFLNLCYTPELAAEVTLQPIRRFGFDAAILFSDILVVPDALGQGVRFVEGEGPVLDPIQDAKGLAALDPGSAGEKYAIVAETVSRVREALPRETALIGFCGAPWTVATYVVEGKGSKEQASARLWAYRDPEGFGQLIDILTESSIAYLDAQVRAGADVLQIFDSWAGSLAGDELAKWVVAPTKRIVSEIKRLHPDVPIIGFARGIGAYISWYGNSTKVDGVGCDTSSDLGYVRDAFDGGPMVVQGNLDPLLLVTGGESLDRRVRKLLDQMDGGRYIFNLGHGIVPQTPPEHVARLVQLVRGEV